MKYACLSLVTHIPIVVSVPFSSFMQLLAVHTTTFLLLWLCVYIKFSVCVEFYFFLLLSVWMVVGNSLAMVHMWKSEGRFIESILCFHLYMGSGNLTQVVGLV